MAAYVADLCRLTEYCYSNYGTTLSKMIRDKVVWGINDEGIQNKLLQEGDKLTLESALTLAQGVETARKNVREMKAPQQELDSLSVGVKFKPENVQKVGGRKPSAGDTGISCHRCGLPDHIATTCKFKDRVCHRCKKSGHLARVCRSKSKSSQLTPGTNSRRPASRPVRQVGEESEDDSEELIQHVYTVEPGRSSRMPPIKVHVQLEDCNVPMEVDTGASVSLISESCTTNCGLGGA